MDVICLGILVADIFSSPIDSLPDPGELAVTDRFPLSAGGCAANTAICLRRLGQEATVVGKVGTDLFGDFVVADLHRSGIDTALVARSWDFHTSQTFILNVRGQDRRYLHHIGANADFSLSDVDLSVLDGGRVLYAGGYLAMPGFATSDMTQLFRLAKQKSLTTVLDVVIPGTTLNPLNRIEPILPHTDYFLPNDDEARLLTGRRDPREQADLLSQLNSRCTHVITRGARGLLAKQGDRTIEIEAFPVEFVDGSGAGDAFAAGLITGVLKGWDWDYTLRFATAVGASCTRAIGCHDGVFSFGEAVAFVGKHTPT